MNFAMLQKAMTGRVRKDSPFSASDYIEDVSDKFNWVDNYFLDYREDYLTVAARIYKECTLVEFEVTMDVVDMLALED